MTATRTVRSRCNAVIRFGVVVLACNERTADHDVHVHRDRERRAWVMWTDQVGTNPTSKA